MHVSPKCRGDATVAPPLYLIGSLLPVVIKMRIGVFYADDITLLSGSRRKLEIMIDVCCNNGVINGITFNPKKSKWFVTDIAKDFSDCEFK